MDPITLTVTAPGSAATAALNGLGSRAVTDAYEALKRYLFGKRISVDKFAEAPDSKIQEERLTEQLLQSGVHEDQTLQTLALRLSRALEQQNSTAGIPRGNILHDFSVTMNGPGNVGVNTGTINFGPKEPTAHEMFEQACSALARGDFRRAILQFRKVCAATPRTDRHISCWRSL